MLSNCYYFFIVLLFLLVSVSVSHQKKLKDARCHMLMNRGCNESVYKILDYEPVGWFYHAPFKSCRQFHAPSNQSLCPQNRDLPLTKEECEDLCGERCKLPSGEYGICMMEGSCKIDVPASYNPRPCGAYNVQCCPKSETEGNDLSLTNNV